MTSEKSSTIVPLSRFRKALASPRADRRIDALISSSNAEAEVQALAVPDLYFLIQEVGLGDSLELLTLCSNEQIQGCVDLSIWDRDLPSIEAFVPWLMALREEGFEFFGRVWEGLDQELMALTLSRLCRIYDKTLGEEVPDEEERDYFETADTFFQIVLTSDDETEIKLVHAIIEDLYRYDMEVARHTIMAARSEPTAELEEMSYRWRSGRMADLGYVDFYEALEVFRPLDPKTVKIGEDTVVHANDAEDAAGSTLPIPVLEGTVGRAFFAHALERLDGAGEIEAMQRDLVFLVNRVLSAARLSPGDREAVEVATDHATASVALGLDQVSGGDVDQAVAALRSISLTRLHRLGYTLTLRLARYARMLAPRAILAGEPSLTVLETLLARRPFFPVILDEAGSTQVRPIESKRDLAVIAEHLRQLALRIAIAGGLGVDLLAVASLEEPRPELDDYVRTALLRACLDEPASCRPLSVAELERFRAEAFDGAELRPDHRRAAYETLVSALDAAEVVEARDALPKMVETWLSELQETFGGVPAGGPIDSAFVSGLILASRMA